MSDDARQNKKKQCDTQYLDIIMHEKHCVHCVLIARTLPSSDSFEDTITTLAGSVPCRFIHGIISIVSSTCPR